MIHWSILKSPTSSSSLPEASTRSSLSYRRYQTNVQRAYMVSTSITDALAGTISKEPTRRKQWVSGAIILILVDGLLRNAIVHGTPSWDMTISRAMSLAVPSATGMRSGDLARSHGYSNQQVTLLGDLVVKVVNDEKGIRFRSLLTLRNTKGHKYVSTLDQRTKMLNVDARDSSSEIILCRWILLLMLPTTLLIRPDSS